jgi:hypothetical protein
LPDDRCEAALEQVVLVAFKHNARMRIDVLKEELVVLWIDHCS